MFTSSLRAATSPNHGPNACCIFIALVHGCMQLVAKTQRQTKGLGEGGLSVVQGKSQVLPLVNRCRPTSSCSCWLHWAKEVGIGDRTLRPSAFGSLCTRTSVSAVPTLILLLCLCLLVVRRCWRGAHQRCGGRADGRGGRFEVAWLRRAGYLHRRHDGGRARAALRLQRHQVRGAPCQY